MRGRFEVEEEGRREMSETSDWRRARAVQFERLDNQ